MCVVLIKECQNEGRTFSYVSSLTREERTREQSVSPGIELQPGT